MPFPSQQEQRTITSSQGHAQLASEDNSAPPIQDGAWRDFAIEETRWNKSYPYQLLVLEANPNGGYSANPDWKFTLPIPPEAFHISTQFPTRTDAAVEGVVEQNSGVRFRYITLKGTTGVMPLRPSAGGAPDNQGLAGLANAAFAGTISNIKAAVNSAQSVISGKVRKPRNLMEDEFEPFAGIPSGKLLPNAGTGYFQFLLLERFLLSYAEAKKKDSGKKLRLAFAVWKTNTVYLVQPLQFDAARDATSPHERRYQLRFKAWARVDPATLGVPLTEIIRPITGRDPNLLAQVLNRITSARRTIASVNKAISSVRVDLASTVWDTIRQITLLIKDTMRIPQTVADTAKGIVKDVHDNLNRNSPDSIQQRLSRSLDLSNSNVKESFEKVIAGPGQSEEVFTNVEEHHEFLSQIPPDIFPLPPTTQQKIDAELARVRAFTRLDYEKARDTIIQASVEFSDAVGAGSDTYDAIYSRTSVTSKNRATPSDEDWEAIFALNELALQIGRLASYADVGPQVPSPVEYIAGLAQKSGIQFTVPNSKFAVPFPYGHTLEQLATRYLGDPNRWHEIAALNNLRAPYVDEVGVDLPLIVNARGSTIVVSDDEHLYLGQAVWLEGAGLSRQKRHIQSIDTSAPGQVRILLDGDPVDQFTLAVRGSAHVYPPGTVNSQMLIFIPSAKRATIEDGQTKSFPGIDRFDHMLRIGGMDLLLTPNRDLALGTDGDARISQGLTNILQIATINLNLPRGSLMRHPNLGFQVKPGSPTADLSAQDVLDAARSALSAYSMFTGVQSALVVKQGPVAQVGLAVGLQGVDDLLQIAVDVQQ